MKGGSSRLASRAAPGSERKILVAVDFGTTHSAVAWTQTRPNHSIEVVDEWPDKANTQDKVPTTLQYGYQGREGPEGNPMAWGFQTEGEQQEPKYQWFKLELDPNLRGTLSGKYPKTAIQPKPEHLEKLVTDYLRILREHTEANIIGTYSISSDALLRGIPWEYIITVPAVWPETAQNTTRKCAKEAGMAFYSPVQIISEPEAAGIFALEHMGREIGLAVGDTFVICDAGGGTVDLISYTITSLTPTRLEESAAGSGALCGSTFLDRRFDDWIRHEFAAFNEWDSGGYHNLALTKWESEIKQNFDGDPRKRCLIPAVGIPPRVNPGIRGSTFEIPYQKMKELFEPIISKILDLVTLQISEAKKNGKTVKAVLLAGGFGRNEYLKKRIQQQVDMTVKVERMKHCNTAIVRGALIQSLASKTAGARLPTIWVDSRIARKHYGTAVLDVYDPDKHDPTRSRVAAGVGGSERIEVMQWFLDKGAKIKESEPVPFQYYFDMSENDVNRQGGKLDLVTLTVYTCNEDARPDYPDPGKCKELVRLTADLNQIPKEKMRKKKGTDNLWYYKIRFHIQMTCHSANISFDLLHEGIKYSSVEVEYR
ncbi:actin-like ATPase domain-containing protein [Xylaria scruposa]|nr:actin-like ATPase domain-containing protein [Xylaria scruposa]